MIPLAVEVQDCWNKIGIAGDRSCPELAKHIVCQNCPVFAAAARTLFERPAPEGYLDEWTQALGHASQGLECDHVSVVILRLGSEWLALAASFLVEVTPPKTIHAVPHRSNDVFRGLVNIRGQLQLCVSLHGVLGIRNGSAPAAPGNGSTQHAAKPLLVVVQQAGERWAFLADEVLGVERIPRSDLRKVPGTLANPVNGFSQAIFTIRDRHVGFLDEQRIVTALRSLWQ